MKQILEYLGPAPFDESPAQMGRDGFGRDNLLEIRAFKDQIIRVCGEPPEGVAIETDWSTVDEGRYGELVLVAKGPQGSEDAIGDYIDRCMRIGQWDDAAILELKKFNYGPLKTDERAAEDGAGSENPSIQPDPTPAPMGGHSLE